MLRENPELYKKLSLHEPHIFSSQASVHIDAKLPSGKLAVLPDMQVEWSILKGGSGASVIVTGHLERSKLVMEAQGIIL